MQSQELRDARMMRLEVEQCSENSFRGVAREPVVGRVIYETGVYAHASDAWSDLRTWKRDYIRRVESDAEDSR